MTSGCAATVRSISDTVDEAQRVAAEIGAVNGGWAWEVERLAGAGPYRDMRTGW